MIFRKTDEATSVFKLPLKATIRHCKKRDLPLLEWFGEYSAHREIFADAWRSHQERRGLMLVCDVGGFPVGQIWIDFQRYSKRSTALVWALRVIGSLQGHGLGTRLLKFAERVVWERGFQAVELGVEKGSPVSTFYERLGYALVGELMEKRKFTTPEGDHVCQRIEQAVYRKVLRRSRLQAIKAQGWRQLR